MTAAASFLAHLLAVLALACITYAAGKGVVVLIEWAQRRARGRKA